MKVTLSVIKADVGSIGSHAKPSPEMLQKAKDMLSASSLLIDSLVTHTGDDISLIMSHKEGKDNHSIHQLAWSIFLEGTEIAKKQGLYGAGQDLLVDAPSGNIRGAGPCVAELEFDLLPKERPAEAFLIFGADKCGPGAYNLPLYQTFCDPMHNGGLLLSPKLRHGFTFNIIDMDNRTGDKLIELVAPQRIWDIAVLLRDIDRYAVRAIYSRYKPDEQIVALSANRLHNIKGVYTGKDDEIAIVRTQGMFPAPEEVVEPYMFGHYVTGDCRGSHNMPIMPMPINSPIVGAYCLPIISCLAFSMNKDGMFSSNYVDMFADRVWDAVRHKIANKAEDFRRQGFFGIAMASKAELAYTGIVDTLDALDKEFTIR